MSTRIDLNSDLGESFGAWKMGNDEAILPQISSANIATGFHAGDPLVMTKTVASAIKHKVVIGAHVAYPDLVGFGRRNMAVTPAQLTADVIYQVGALQAIAQAQGAQVSYIKPHGALYNTIARDKAQAMAVLEAVQKIDKKMPLMVLAGSELVGWACEAGVKTVSEAFADRAYQADGSLVPRTQEGAVLHAPAQVAEQVLSMIKEGGLRSIDGQFVKIEADSICLHGDTPEAVEMAAQLRRNLEQNGVEIRSFCKHDTAKG